jgi:hypothetical protein
LIITLFQYKMTFLILQIAFFTLIKLKYKAFINITNTLIVLNNIIFFTANALSLITIDTTLLTLLF